jgi:parallel beta-helix repeat protein
VFSGALAVLAPAAQAVVLACGTTLFTPGTYVLTADIDCSATPVVFGVRIIVDDVTLDLNGHKIIGNLASSTDLHNIGVYVTSGFGSANNAVVKNGEITAWDNGVYLEQVNNGRVQSMNIHDNIGPDIQDIFGEGIQVFEGGGHTITGNQVVHNGPFAGIVVYGNTSNNTVTNNAVRNNNILGEDHGGAGPTMQDIGIWVVLSPNTGNLVSGNSVTGNGLDGIQLGFATGPTTVQSNSVVNNGFGQPPANPFRDGSGIAIFGSNNLVQSNQTVGNGAAGIGVLFPPNGNSTQGKNNTIRLNSSLLNGAAATPSTPFDLYDQNTSPPCDNNAWITNVFLTRNQTCIH